MGEDPIAKVQWWDNRNLHVLCPYCSKLHRHGFDGDYDERHFRIAHCGRGCRSPRGPYELQFPWQNQHNETSYEIDRKQFRFVAGHAIFVEPPLSVEEEDRHRINFRCTFEAKQRWTEAMTVPISELVMGEVAAIEGFLETPENAQLLVQGVRGYYTTINDEVDKEDDASDTDAQSLPFLTTDGVTALHLAAAEAHPKMIKLLLQHGADVNAVNKDGVTPLMEASFWGRVANVRILLDHDADKAAQCIVGGYLRTARDLAMDTADNKERRHVRAGGTSDGPAVYREDTFLRDADRQEILQLLATNAPEPVAPRLTLFNFHQDTTTPKTLVLSTIYDRPDKYKTIAVLHRDKGLKDIAAMSGWAKRKSDVILDDGKNWTEKVHELCRAVGHELPAHERDCGTRGNYMACHAEKQLIAYFVNRHIFQEHELYHTLEPFEDELSARLENTHLSDAQVEEFERKLEEEFYQRYKCSELHHCNPPHPLKSASIMISTAMCPDCVKFVGEINAHFELELTLQHHCSGRECKDCNPVIH